MRITRYSYIDERQVRLMSWEKPVDDQQQPNPYVVARAQEKSEVTVLLHADDASSTGMESLRMKAISMPGRWLGKFAAKKVAGRLSGDALPEIANGEEVVTVYTPLTSELGHILQQGQRLVADAVRVRKPDGTFELRKIAPVAIGVIAALSVGAAVAVKRHRK